MEEGDKGEVVESEKGKEKMRMKSGGSGTTARRGVERKKKSVVFEQRNEFDVV